MKMIAVASCYSHHNYGSMLQALATQMALDVIGIENETINVSGINDEIVKAKMRYFAKASFTSDILLHKFGMFENLIRIKLLKDKYAKACSIRDMKFEEFKKDRFRLSEAYLSKDELSNVCQEKYSAVLVGSDQLWLPANIEADYYTLSFVPEEINTIAYATSFGQAILPKSIARKATYFLKRIRHISVREEAGQKLVKELTGREVPVVCDPTLLFGTKEWDRICGREPLPRKPYILCYFLGNNPLHREFAKKLSGYTGLKIIALVHLDEYIKYDEKYADETPYNIGPGEFLDLIRHARYVCTDSFHCTVFSIMYRKEFYTFHRYSGKTIQSTNSRIDTLFRMTGIPGRLLTGEENVEECMNTSINFDEVHKKIDAIRFESYEYLKIALNDERSTDL